RAEPYDDGDEGPRRPQRHGSPFAVIGADREERGERDDDDGDEERPLSGPPDPARRALDPRRVPDPAGELGAEDQEPEDEKGREPEDRDEEERGQAPPHEATPLLEPEGPVQRAHEGARRAGRGPQGEEAAEDDEKR